MSSNEDQYDDGDTSSALLRTNKKRRIQRACDICRRKKVRCDGMQMPKRRCTNCISCSSECTYVEAAKKRGPPKGYVESLENRVKFLEQLLRRFCPDETVFKELLAPLDGNSTIKRPPGDYIANQAQPDAAGIGAVSAAIRGVIQDNSDSSRSSTDRDHDNPTSSLAEKFSDMALHNSHNSRFLGKSSGGTLIQTAVDMLVIPENPTLKNDDDILGMKPWEEESYATASPEYSFPDANLALHCIDLYFKCINLYLPLLHRPTFDKDVEKGLHLTNEGFGSVYLLVCAIGARHSDDPRVLLDGVDMKHSSGWKWFEQVQIMKGPPLKPASLYDLQLYGLCATYLIGTSSPQSSWTMVGIGIRLAQEVGAHRRKIHKHPHTAEDELWKRAFWVLVWMDRIASSALGRSCAIQDEEFDLDLPVNCDDEYWDNPDPEKCFKQPPNKPSSITAFLLSLKLNRILTISLRTIYAFKRPRMPDQPSEQNTVEELDSVLNKWADSIPNYLRWDPCREDDNFFSQSAFLYVSYYDLQIIIHRPFISSPDKPSPLTLSSLAICTNAARSSSHVLGMMRERNTICNLPPYVQIPALTAGIVLLVNLWGGKRSGLSTNLNKEMVDVYQCMRLLEESKERWYPAGSLWRVLVEFTRLQKLPLPQKSPPRTKREREPDTPLPTGIESPSDSMSHEIPRTIAGSRRVHREFSFTGETKPLHNPLPQPQRLQTALPPSATRASHLSLPPPKQASSRQSQMRQNPEAMQTPSANSLFISADRPLFALPVYTSELVRFPPHEQIGDSAPARHSQPQTHLPQLHPQVNHWYTMSGIPQRGERSEPTSHASTSGTSSSYWSQDSSVIPHPDHASQSIRTSGFSSMNVMSLMAQAPYQFEAAQMATGMMPDSVVGGLAYTQQQTSTYGWSTDLSNPDVGSRSTVTQSSPGSSLEDVYGEVGMDNMPDSSYGYSSQQHHHQGVPQPQEHQPFTYPFGVENDTVGIWLNAPTGFGPEEWWTYFTSVGEVK